jgi:hypothetical protein
MDILFKYDQSRIIKFLVDLKAPFFGSMYKYISSALVTTEFQFISIQIMFIIVQSIQFWYQHIMRLHVQTLFLCSRHTSVGVVARQRTGQPRSRGLILSRGKWYFFFHRFQTGSISRPSSCPIGTRRFPPRDKGWSVKLTTHFQLVPRIWMRGAITPQPGIPSRRGA